MARKIGRLLLYKESHLRLYYFQDQYGNFGDDLNPWLWENLFPGFLRQTDEDLFIGVGTLLNHRIPAAPSFTVFGSGHGYGRPPKITTNWKFYCVRGPLTAESLGLSRKLAVTDPASLAPIFFRHEKEREYPVSFMPHCESARLGDWAYVCEQAGIQFIDPRKPFLEVFAGICRSRVLLTEAMHGAILADSFRIPWIPVKAYSHISEYKWQDWLQSVQLNAEFVCLPSIWRGDDCNGIVTKLKNGLKRRLLETPFWQETWSAPPHLASSRRQIDEAVQLLQKIAGSSTAHLSTEPVFAENTERLMEIAQRFRADFGI